MVIQGPAQEATGGLDRRRYVFVNDCGTNYTMWAGVGAGNIFISSSAAAQDKQTSCATPSHA